MIKKGQFYRDRSSDTTLEVFNVEYLFSPEIDDLAVKCFVFSASNNLVCGSTFFVYGQSDWILASVDNVPIIYNCNRLIPIRNVEFLR